MGGFYLSTWQDQNCFASTGLGYSALTFQVPVPFMYIYPIVNFASLRLGNSIIHLIITFMIRCQTQYKTSVSCISSMKQRLSFM